MNDLLDDDLLRSALHAEVSSVQAGDDLLRRIQARPVQTARPRVRWMLVAAALAVAVGVAASLALDAEDPARIDTIDDATTTVPDTSTTIESPPVPPARPSQVALVREDGRLVLFDLETGDERELAFHGDPRDTNVEGGPYYIDGVELSPDGRWVYYSTCCEPAVGTTYRVSVDGGEPERVSDGAYPRLSPDGRYLAVSHAMGITVLDITSEPRSVAMFDIQSLQEILCCVGHLAWSPNGRQLAYLAGAGDPGTTPFQAGLLDFDGTSLTPADTGKPDNPASWVTWLPDGMLNLVSGEPVVDDRSLTQDASYHWIIWVDEAGVVREQAGQTGELTPIPGLPPALTADW